MNTFLNPVEIFGLQGVAVFDPSSLKKAKRQLQNEIALSDNGYLIFKGRQLSLSELESLSSRLEEQSYYEAMQFVAANATLSSLLHSYDVAYFYSNDNNKVPSKEVLQHISNHYASVYDTLLVKAFKDKDHRLLTNMKDRLKYVLQNDTDRCYQSVRRELRLLEDGLKAIVREVADLNEPNETKLSNYLVKIQGLIDVNVLNLLSDYFLHQRGDLAVLIRAISIDIWNKHSHGAIAISILKYAVGAKVTNEIQRKFNEDKLSLEKAIESRKDQTKVLTIFQELSVLSEKIKSSEAKIAVGNSYITNAGTVLADYVINKAEISLINKIDNQDISEAFVRAIRNIGINVWNRHTDGASAIKILRHALKIQGLNSEDQRDIIDNINHIEYLYTAFKDALIKKQKEIESEKQAKRFFTAAIISFILSFISLSVIPDGYGGFFFVVWIIAYFIIKGIIDNENS